VRFAGYRVPHPLINDAHIKVQTYNQRTHPIKVFQSALEDLLIETNMLDKQFEVSDSLYLIYEDLGSVAEWIEYVYRFVSQAAVDDFEQREGM
jgi:hypothetical protein